MNAKSRIEARAKDLAEKLRAERGLSFSLEEALQQALYEEIDRMAERLEKLEATRVIRRVRPEIAIQEEDFPCCVCNKAPCECDAPGPAMVSEGKTSAWKHSTREMPPNGTHVCFLRGDRGQGGTVADDGKLYRWDSVYPVGDDFDWVELPTPPWATVARSAQGKTSASVAGSSPAQSVTSVAPAVPDQVAPSGFIPHYIKEETAYNHKVVDSSGLSEELRVHFRAIKIELEDPTGWNGARFALDRIESALLDSQRSEAEQRQAVVDIAGTCERAHEHSRKLVRQNAEQGKDLAALRSFSARLAAHTRELEGRLARFVYGDNSPAAEDNAQFLRLRTENERLREDLGRSGIQSREKLNEELRTIDDALAEAGQREGIDAAAWIRATHKENERLTAELAECRAEHASLSQHFIEDQNSLAEAQLVMREAYAALLPATTREERNAALASLEKALGLIAAPPAERPLVATALAKCTQCGHARTQHASTESGTMPCFHMAGPAQGYDCDCKHFMPEGGKEDRPSLKRCVEELEIQVSGLKEELAELKAIK